MASHMGVQTFATERNSQVEFLVHFILAEFLDGQHKAKQLNNIIIESQKPYASDIASDVWDHFVLATQPNGRQIEIWCQTTCYKGNGTGTPEPNKTYEVRETLVEGLSIRQRFCSDPTVDFRSIHFTVGDSRYTYQWFLDLKGAAYDKSIYIGEANYDIFDEIAATLRGAFTESDMVTALKSCVANNTTLGKHISKALDELNTWWIILHHNQSELADSQWKLISSEFQSASSHWPNFSAIHGQDIKGRTNATIFSEEMDTSDPLIPRTASKLLDKNPFLASAIQILGKWDSFCSKLSDVALDSKSLKNFLLSLWNSPLPIRLVLRRVLLRIHTPDSIAYVQDRDIEGVTEHNLYSGDHTLAQAEKICGQIENNLKVNNIHKAQDLLDVIETRGKRLINQARWFEAKNGTELKPSFDYVQLALEDAGYKVVSPSKAGFRAIGFHSEISSENVRPYTNLKVVLDPTGKALCILKAKFFRTQEFPRRCKEEAFVGLTLKYKYANKAFSKRFDIPLIMFVDMASNTPPPAHALKRLISFGWQVVFSTTELISYLQSQSGR